MAHTTRPLTYSGTTAYTLFNPNGTSQNAISSSIDTVKNTFTLTFSTLPSYAVPNDVGDWHEISGGTFTGNTWNGIRQVVSFTATTITYQLPYTPGVYVSGVVAALPVMTFNPGKFTTQAPGAGIFYVKPLPSFQNATSIASITPSNDVLSATSNTTIEQIVPQESIFFVKLTNAGPISLWQ